MLEYFDRKLQKFNQGDKDCDSKILWFRTSGCGKRAHRGRRRQFMNGFIDFIDFISLLLGCSGYLTTKFKGWPGSGKLEGKNCLVDSWRVSIVVEQLIAISGLTLMPLAEYLEKFIRSLEALNRYIAKASERLPIYFNYILRYSPCVLPPITTQILRLWSVWYVYWIFWAEEESEKSYGAESISEQDICDGNVSYSTPIELLKDSG